MKKGNIKEIIAGIIILSIIAIAYLSIEMHNAEKKILGVGSVAVDSKGNIFVIRGEEILKLDKNGNLLKKVSIKEELEKTIPVELFIDPRDYLFLYVEKGEDRKIQKLDPDGRLIFEFGSTGRDDGQFRNAIEIAFHPFNNDIYVSDCANHRIQVFDPNGNFKFSFGSLGSKDEYFNFPNGIVFDDKAHLYIADTNNHRIVEVDDKGNFVKSFYVASTLRKKTYIWPVYLLRDEDGYIYVSMLDWNLEKSKIKKFSPQGKLVKTFKTVEAFDIDNPRDGRYLQPYVSCFDSEGNILVGDEKNIQIERFDKEGNYLGRVESLELRKEFNNLYRQRIFYKKVRIISNVFLIILGLIILIIYLITKLPVIKKLIYTPKIKEIPEGVDLPKVSRRTEIIVRCLSVMTALFIIISLLIPKSNTTFLNFPLVVIFLLTISVTTSFIIMVKKGIFTKNIILGFVKIYLFLEPKIKNILLDGENILKYSFLFDSPLVPTFLILTNLRIILIKVDRITKTMQGIIHIGYDSVEQITPTKFYRKKFGTFPIDITFSNSKKLQLNFFLKESADNFIKMIDEQKKIPAFGRVRTREQGMEELCPKCYKPLKPETLQCSHCSAKFKDPKVAALLSAIYSGLGQLYNEQIFKGLGFIIIYTILLSLTYKVTLAFYEGFAEVSLGELFSSWAYTISIWIFGITDAYYSAKHKLK